MNVLNHLAIIADGNGRWAEKQGLSRQEGHKVGIKKVEDIVKWCYHANIKILSIYLFSLDNWKRPEEEINNLRTLADEYVTNY
jgi:undecaprenyl diphosphate synthase